MKNKTKLLISLQLFGITIGAAEKPFGQQEVTTLTKILGERPDLCKKTPADVLQENLIEKRDRRIADLFSEVSELRKSINLSSTKFIK